MRKKFLLGALVLSSLIVGKTFAQEDQDDWSMNKHFFISAEYMFMKESGADGDPVVEQNGVVILDTTRVAKSLGFEPGYRITGQFLFNDKAMFEASYLQIQQWSGLCSKFGSGDLDFPFDDPASYHDYTDADDANVSYESRYNCAELNYYGFMTPPKEHYFSVAGIFGIRRVSLKEEFEAAFTKGSDTSDYRIKTKNTLWGAHVGLRLELNPTRRMSWEFMARAGAGVDRASQTTFLADDNNTTVLRNYDYIRDDATFILDGSIKLSYMVFDWLSAYGGYAAFYYSGMALAPDQIDYSDATARDDRIISVSGDPLFQGAFIGLKFGF